MRSLNHPCLLLTENTCLAAMHTLACSLLYASCEALLRLQNCCCTVTGAAKLLLSFGHFCRLAVALWVPLGYLSPFAVVRFPSSPSVLLVVCEFASRKPAICMCPTGKYG